MNSSIVIKTIDGTEQPIRVGQKWLVRDPSGDTTRVFTVSSIAKNVRTDLWMAHGSRATNDIIGRAKPCVASCKRLAERDGAALLVDVDEHGTQHTVNEPLPEVSRRVIGRNGAGRSVHAQVTPDVFLVRLGGKTRSRATDITSAMRIRKQLGAGATVEDETGIVYAASAFYGDYDRVRNALERRNDEIAAAARAAAARENGRAA